MLLKREEQAILSLRQLYAARGYRPYKMSRFEEYDLYVQNKDFLLSEQIITFPGRDGRLMALKPDVTLSIIKNAPEEEGAVAKVYYNESVYRAGKDTGELRELTQVGLECVGDLTDYDISEVVLLAMRSLSSLGENYILDISHMGLIESVLQKVPDNIRKTVFNFIRQKNVHELAFLCKEQQFDSLLSKKICSLVTLCGYADEVLDAAFLQFTSVDEQKALTELKSICTVLQSVGYKDNVRIDFSVGNGMGYYSGLVFCGYLAGLPESILTGGQYDKLPQRMGKRSRAIGFAIRLDLLERLEQGESAYDLDAVLLIQKESDMCTVNRVLQGMTAEKNVLVSTNIPDGCTFGRVYRLEGEEAVFLGSND